MLSWTYHNIVVLQQNLSNAVADLVALVPDMQQKPSLADRATFQLKGVQLKCTINVYSIDDEVLNNRSFQQFIWLHLCGHGSVSRVSVVDVGVRSCWCWGTELLKVCFCSLPLVCNSMFLCECFECGYISVFSVCVLCVCVCLCLFVCVCLYVCVLQAVRVGDSRERRREGEALNVWSFSITLPSCLLNCELTSPSVVCSSSLCISYDCNVLNDVRPWVVETTGRSNQCMIKE